MDGALRFDPHKDFPAETADTDFISVDGDNIIDESFLLQTLDWFDRGALAGKK